MRNAIFGILLLLSTFRPSSSLIAAPLDITRVAANAKWLVHVDVDAMHDSTVVRRAYEKQLSSWPDVAAIASAVIEQMCLDPAQDLRGITAYGPTPGTQEGVLLVHASADRAGMVEKLKRAPGYRTGQYRSWPLHSWTQADGNVTCGFFRDDVLVFSKTEQETTAALDVLEGRSPGLPAGNAVLTGTVPAGTILLIRAMGLADESSPLQSPLVRHVRSLHVALGEHAGKSFSEARLVAESADAATQLREIAEGLLAAAMLQYGHDPAAAKIIRSTQVKVEGDTLKIAAELPAEEVWSVMEQAWDHPLPK